MDTPKLRLPSPNARIQDWEYTYLNTDITLIPLLFISVLFTPENKIVSASIAPTTFTPYDPSKGLILTFSGDSPASLLPEHRRTVFFDRNVVGTGRIMWRIDWFRAWSDQTINFFKEEGENQPKTVECNEWVLEVYFPDLRRVCVGVKSNLTTLITCWNEKSGEVKAVHRFCQPDPASKSASGARMALLKSGRVVSLERVSFPVPIVCYVDDVEEGTLEEGREVDDSEDEGDDWDEGKEEDEENEAGEKDGNLEEEEEEEEEKEERENEEDEEMGEEEK